MNMNDYDTFVKKMCVYPRKQDDSNIISVMYCALGLAGESGECVDKIKKWHRDGIIDRDAIAHELGDVLFYVCALGGELGYRFQELVSMNVKKLQDRKDRGVIHGSGDNR